MDTRNSSDLAAKAAHVDYLLVSMYGDPQWYPRWDPLSALIATVLSQNTSDTNSERAFAALMHRFGTFEAVRDAPPAEIADAIRAGGLANIKAPRIKALLQTITELHGTLTLDFLNTMPTEKARRWLNSLQGVGPKTTACVLMFALGRHVLPVDTHVHRTTRRIGLISPKTTAVQAHDVLEAIVVPERRYAYHVNLIRHGRQTCTAQRPACERCAVRPACDYYRTLVSAASGSAQPESETGTR